MKRFLLLVFLLVSVRGYSAAVSPAEKLLPQETLFVLSIPDCSKLRTVMDKSPKVQLWNDPAMKPFREHLMGKFNSDVIEPLEKELGVKFEDYKQLAQGQLTYALVQNKAPATGERDMDFIVLLDAKNKSDLLKKNLSALKKKWADSGKELKTQKLRDIEFTTLITTGEQIDNALKNVPGQAKDPAEVAEDNKEKKAKKFEMMVGQADSLLIAGSSPKLIEKVLINLSGGLVPTLSEESTYEANHAAFFRDAYLFAWLNLKPLIQNFKTPGSTDADAPMTQKMLGSLGINGLKSLAVAFNDAPDGGLIKIFIGAPESNRQGLVKMFIAEKKDANPPPFVPTDAVKFTRWRLDLQKLFNGFEAMMSDINPAYTGIFKLVLENAGKDQDPNFDLRKELIGNLGDDLITYEKNPRGTSAEELDSPPSLFLLSSPNAEKLAHALKIGLGSLTDPASLKDREFLGRKIYSLAVPPMANAGKTAKPKTLFFAASGGYVGITTDVSILEEYLRSNDGKSKPLSETAGLTEAAQKVGGMGNGLFVFENQAEQMRVTMEGVKKTSGSMTTLFGGGALENLPLGDGKAMKSWADFSLLPSFDAISKYFYFTVYAGNVDATGMTITMFSPVPPGLKK